MRLPLDPKDDSAEQALYRSTVGKCGHNRQRMPNGVNLPCATPGCSHGYEPSDMRMSVASREFTLSPWTASTTANPFTSSSVIIREVRYERRRLEVSGGGATHGTFLWAQLDPWPNQSDLLGNLQPDQPDSKKGPFPPGPWDDEPDYQHWEVLPGIWGIVSRQPNGNLTGYIGVAVDHPWWGKDYDAIDASAHGGLTYGSEDKPGPVTMSPQGSGKYAFIEQREADGRWWFGFDCAHSGDMVPSFIRIGGVMAKEFMLGGHYWTWDEVKAEVEQLAAQAKEAK